MSADRHAIDYRGGPLRFNVRTAGIAMRENHVLVAREDDDNYTMLPGGRVELGEGSQGALEREIAEELKCTGEVGRLLFSVENFYAIAGERFHQIGLYYALMLPGDFPFETGAPCLVTQDEGHDLTFEWIMAEPASLARMNLLPNWLCQRISALPERTEHLVIDELGGPL